MSEVSDSTQEQDGVYDMAATILGFNKETAKKIVLMLGYAASPLKTKESLSEELDDGTDVYAKLAKNWGVERFEVKNALLTVAYLHSVRPRSPIEQVMEFHHKFGLEYTGGTRHLPSDLAIFRIMFMIEELAEYAGASGFTVLEDEMKGLIERLKTDGDYIRTRDEKTGVEAFQALHDQLDSLVDLSYVLHGTAYLQGFEQEKAFEVVHRKNMEKVRVERAEDSKRGSAFDVVKPEGWTPPDLTPFLDQD